MTMAATCFTATSSYNFLKFIGSGGFGDVWLCERRIQGSLSQVVLKIPRDQTNHGLRYLSDEMEALQKLRHPHIVACLGMELLSDGRRALVLEYLSGPSLAAMMQGPAELGISTRRNAEALPLFFHLYEALDYAHRSGFIHGDVCPQNIIFDASGAPKIADFGLALTHKHSQGQCIGRPQYMAPERWRGQILAAGDVFSLGVLAFHWLTGKPLWSCENESEGAPTFEALRERPWKDLPSPWCELFDKVLVEDPMRRWSARKSAEFLRRALPPWTQTFAPTLIEDVLPHKRGRTHGLRRLQRYIGSLIAVCLLFSPVVIARESGFQGIGWISIFAYPYAQLEIDGGSPQYTPLVKTPLAAGVHTVEWSKPGIKKRRTTIRLVVRKEITLTL